MLDIQLFYFINVQLKNMDFVSNPKLSIALVDSTLTFLLTKECRLNPFQTSLIILLNPQGQNPYL